MKSIQFSLIIISILIIGCAERDISTPSKTLVGHWINAGGDHTYFSPNKFSIELTPWGEPDWYFYEVIEEDPEQNYLKIHFVFHNNEGFIEFKFSEDNERAIQKLWYIIHRGEKGEHKIYEANISYVDNKQIAEKYAKISGHKP
jgi:hypothetical protein